MRYRLRLHGQEIRLLDGETLLGRGEECRITLYDVLVSRVHASIVVDERAVITDMGSRNGTWVDGRLIVEPTVLQHGSIIQLGRQELRLLVATERQLVESARPDDAVPSLEARRTAGPREDTAPETGSKWQVSLLLELLPKLQRSGRRRESDRVLDQLLRRLESGERCVIDRAEAKMLRVIARDSELPDVLARLASALLRHGVSLDYTTADFSKMGSAAS